MMIGFEPIANPILSGAIFAAAAAISLASYLGKRRLLRKSHLMFLTILRLVSLAMLLIILLRPFYERTEPDPSSFSVAVLADASGSMLAEDCGERKRMEVAASIIDGNPSELLAVQGSPIGNLEKYIFSENSVRYFGGGFSVQPGMTATGDIIRGTAEKPSWPPLGAIVLISDGNSNTGADLIETVKEMRHLGIPISCIGTGDTAPLGDIEVRAPEKPISGKKGEELEISAFVKNSFAGPAEVEIELQRGGVRISGRKLSVPAGAEMKCAFATVPPESGRNVYRISARSANLKDRKLENNIAFAIVQVAEPDTFRILYLGSSLDWNFKFLKLHCAEGRQFVFDAAVKNGESNFFLTDGISSKLPKDARGFPTDTGIFFGYDALVVDQRGLGDMPEKYPEAFAKFAGDKGGGVIFLGTPPQDFKSEFLQELMPMRSTVQKRDSGKHFLRLEAPYVFDEGDSAALYEPPGPPLPAGLDYLCASSLKAAARSCLSDPGGNAVLCIQNYGAGRTAFLGLDSVWRWHLGSAAELEKYRAFWNSLMVWMASGGKKRIRLGADGRKFTIGEEAVIRADILDRNYLPASDADVTAVLTRPDGSSEEIPLPPSGRREGQFSESFVPAIPGEYRLDTTAKFRDGENISASGSFLCAYGGVESLRNEFREDILADVARLTGGGYFGWRDLKNGMEIPVSARIETRKVRIGLAENFVFPVLLFALLGAEWYFRRRIGLK